MTRPTSSTPNTVLRLPAGVELKEYLTIDRGAALFAEPGAAAYGQLVVSLSEETFFDLAQAFRHAGATDVPYVPAAPPQESQGVRNDVHVTVKAGIVDWVDYDATRPPEAFDCFEARASAYRGADGARASAEALRQDPASNTYDVASDACETGLGELSAAQIRLLGAALSRLGEYLEEREAEADGDDEHGAGPDAPVPPSPLDGVDPLAAASAQLRRAITDLIGRVAVQADPAAAAARMTAALDEAWATRTSAPA